MTQLPDHQGRLLTTRLCQSHTMEASHWPFECWASSRKAVNTNFSSHWFDPTGNRTQVCSNFGCRILKFYWFLFLDVCKNMMLWDSLLRPFPIWTQKIFPDSQIAIPMVFTSHADATEQIAMSAFASQRKLEKNSVGVILVDRTPPLNWTAISVRVAVY